MMPVARSLEFSGSGMTVEIYEMGLENVARRPPNQDKGFLHNSQRSKRREHLCMYTYVLVCVDVERSWAIPWMDFYGSCDQFDIVSWHNMHRWLRTRASHLSRFNLCSQLDELICNYFLALVRGHLYFVLKRSFFLLYIFCPSNSPEWHHISSPRSRILQIHSFCLSERRKTMLFQPGCLVLVRTRRYSS